MLYQYCHCIMTVNSSYLKNPDGGVAIIYSAHYFFIILYYDMMFYLQKTYPLPASEFDYPMLWGARHAWGAGDYLCSFRILLSLIKFTL